MIAEIVSTGTELVQGETLNTNAHYLSGKLSALGIEVAYHTTVDDHAGRLENVLRQAVERSDLIFTTGGLGPTLDDLTKELTAKVLDLELALDSASLETIKAYFTSRQRPMPVSNEKQAYFPKGAKILSNPFGTAPGALIEKNGKTVVILPGPPHEMTAMFENHVWPELQKIVTPDMVRLNERILKVFGMGESAIEEQLAGLPDIAQAAVSLLIKKAEIHVHLVTRGTEKNLNGAADVLDRTELEIRKRLGNKVFGRDQETMAGIVGRQLKSKKLTIATAESCTGGLLGAALTTEPGSSVFYLGGAVSYSDALKRGLLGVNEESLFQYGAVSETVAGEMAEGIRLKAGADLALSTTGIAGPDGGSDLKPVGLVYIGLATPEGVLTERFQFFGDRENVRSFTVQAALNKARVYLLEK